mmetsp:Transcript_14746/g.17167  ORF Transcript_14746/g.17167 Transcript_14746/m.17167 type:complete len:498 (-) Transcript_14746:2092-3585(-)
MSETKKELETGIFQSSSANMNIQHTHHLNNTSAANKKRASPSQCGSSASVSASVITTTATGSMTDISPCSTRTSFELEYSDEETSVTSSDYDDQGDEYYNQNQRYNQATNMLYIYEDFDNGYDDVDNDNDNVNDNDDHLELQVNEKVKVKFPSSSSISTSVRSLVVDEIPAIQSKALAKRQHIPPTILSDKRGNGTGIGAGSNISSIQRPMSSKNKNTKLIACPCCRSYVDDEQFKKHQRFPKSWNHNSEDEDEDEDYDKNKNAFTSLMDNIWSDSSSPSRKKEQQVSSQVMPKSLEYKVKTCIFEGWLHKKGTGNDLFGSTSWKPRWCSLVMADIPDYVQEVPLFIVSWHSTLNPSNVIILDSSMAIPIDQINNESSSLITSITSRNVNNSSATTSNHDNTHCFDIVSTRSDSNGTLTRTFSASLTERNHWLNKINETVHEYQKKTKSSSSRQKINQDEKKCLPPTSPGRTSSSTSGNSREYNGKVFDLSGLNIAC